MMLGVDQVDRRNSSGLCPADFAATFPHHRCGSLHVGVAEGSALLQSLEPSYGEFFQKASDGEKMFRPSGLWRSIVQYGLARLELTLLFNTFLTCSEGGG